MVAWGALTHPAALLLPCLFFRSARFGLLLRLYQATGWGAEVVEQREQRRPAGLARLRAHPLLERLRGTIELRRVLSPPRRDANLGRPLQERVADPFGERFQRAT